MRKTLLSAAAAAPLALLSAPPALAQVTISNSDTSQVQTATANNGQPSDVTISGSVTLSTPGPAVILNSSNNLANSGSISIEGQNGAVGVQIVGGVGSSSTAASFTNSGAITINESYSATDTNNDGIADGAFAQGSGRYGVRMTAPGTFTGNIITESGSSISVQGNSSYGMSLETPMVGNLTLGGTISGIGNATTGLNVAGSVNGAVEITGGIAVSGGAATTAASDIAANGSVGANFSGDVSGSLRIYAPLESSGYHQSTRSTDPTINAELIGAGKPNTDFYFAGPALIVGSNVAGGVFIGAPPPGTNSTDSTTDADQDGIVDSVEGAGSVTTYGANVPAMLVGSSTRDITLGPFANTTFNGYGLIIEGVVFGSGVFDGYGANGLQIGGLGHAVNIQGGVKVTGAVVSLGYEASSTAFSALAGANIPTLNNQGTILSTVSVSPNSTVQPPSNLTSTAISIGPGATFGSITNIGGIIANMDSDTGSAIAIQDKSGTLTSLTNEGVISATITPEAIGDKTSGSTVALDLSSSTANFKLIQQANTSGATIFTTATDPSSGLNTTATATVPTTPSITGDILLGSGNNDVEVQAGTVSGALSFAGGDNTLSIGVTGGTSGSYVGPITVGTGGMLNMTVNNGTLEDDSANAIKATSLNVNAGGQLIISADPANNTATSIAVNGPVNIASGGSLGLHLLSVLQGPATYTVITGTSLNIASPSALTGKIPFLYIASFAANTSNDTISVSVSPRTPEQAGLNKVQAAAFYPIYNELFTTPDIERAFLAQTTQAGLVTMMDQMLPDQSGDIFRALDWASEQQGVATGEPPIGQDQEGPTRAWTQEIVMSEQKNAGETTPYDTLAFGIVGGIESVSAKGDALGVKLGFVTANIHDPELPSYNNLGASELNTGLYWRGAFGPVRADAQLGAGFIWVNSHREFLYSDDLGVVHRTATADWTGYELNGRFGLQYTANFGAFFLQPRVHADYFRLHEGGYAEQGGGDGFDLVVDGRTGQVFTVTSSVVAGANFGSGGFRWRPQIEAGYRSVLSGSAGDTTADFAGASDPFTLASETLRQGSLIGRVGLHIYATYLDLLLDGGIQHNSVVTDYDVHLTARTVF